MAGTGVAGLSPELLQELMRQYGYEATGGNYRMTPFATPPVETAGQGVEIPTDEEAGARVNSDGSIVDLDGDPLGVITPQGVVDAQGQPIDLSGMGFDPTPFLAGGAGGLIGWAIADALRKRKGKPPRVPQVEGEVMPRDPLAPLSGPEVEGEYTDVNPPRQVGQVVQEGGSGFDVAAALAEQKRIPPPPRNTATGSTATAAALEDRPTPPRHLSRREMAERRSRPNARTSRSTEPAIVTDRLTDISDVERQQASAIADQLIERRRQGNKGSRANRGRRAPGGAPTGSTDKESLIHTIVRMLRETGTTKAAQSALR